MVGVGCDCPVAQDGHVRDSQSASAGLLIGSGNDGLRGSSTARCAAPKAGLNYPDLGRH
jgi:hypothetical protein